MNDYLQYSRHEDWAAHQHKNHKACHSLFSDAQELGLFSRSGALRFQFEAVHMCDGQDGCSHKPGQAHDGADTQHDGHHEQVQVVTTAFL